MRPEYFSTYTQIHVKHLLAPISPFSYLPGKRLPKVILYHSELSTLGT